MTGIFIPHWITAVFLLWGLAVFLFLLFRASCRNRRKHIIARLNAGDSHYDALVEELAEMDGAPFNGHYYWHKCVKPGVDPDSLIGLRGAIQAGGLGAGRAYGQIISGKAGRDE